VRKLQRVKVLFEDDLRAAVASFDTAFGEVEQRVLQVVHNYVDDRKKPDSDSVVSKTQKRRMAGKRDSTSVGSGSIRSGSVSGSLKPDSEHSSEEVVNPGGQRDSISMGSGSIGNGSGDGSLKPDSGHSSEEVVNPLSQPSGDEGDDAAEVPSGGTTGA
jgi:hypothetical protein